MQQHHARIGKATIGDPDSLVAASEAEGHAAFVDDGEGKKRRSGGSDEQYSSARRRAGAYAILGADMEPTAEPDSEGFPYSFTRRVYGVFKGGGAKGVVYAGALRQLAARGIWFRSVAGSSAGAITAMLIAVGTGPNEFAKAACDALPKVRRQLLWGGLPGRSGALFDTTGLRDWLEKYLRDAIRGKDSADTTDVTFQELHVKRPLIDLDVVALDLDRRQPIVFNYETTSECSVAAAVVASCAIPVAMPPGRVVLVQAAAESGQSRAATSQIHRVVDGGAWANYPSFVYLDSDFRRFHNLEPYEIERDDVLGFVIVGDEDNGESSAGVPPAPPESILTVEPRRSNFDRGAGRQSGRLGAVLSWTGLRWAVGRDR